MSVCVRVLGEIFAAGAVIGAIFGLVTGKATVSTGGFSVEPGAVGIKTVLDVIFVPREGF